MADKLLDSVDALLAQYGGSSEGDTDDPVLKDVDALLAPYEVTTAERTDTSKALEVGKWPGDEAVAQPFREGGRKAFDQARDARMPQMRQLKLAREQELALQQEPGFLDRASDFATNLLRPSPKPAAPVEDSPAVPVKLPVETQPSFLTPAQPAPPEPVPPTQVIPPQGPPAQTSAPEPWNVPHFEAAPPLAGQVPKQYPTENFENFIQESAARHGLNPHLLRAVIRKESNFNPRAQSGAGAQGLTQMLPGTAKDMGVQDIWDPPQAIEGGAKYLAQLLKRYKGDEAQALAAYNWGMRHIDAGEAWPKETQDYVQKIRRWAAMGGESPIVKAKLRLHPFEQARANPPLADIRMGQDKTALRLKLPEFEKAGYDDALATMPLGELGTERVGETAEGRPIINNPDGSVSTERTTTLQIGGKWMNIPTMFDGKQVSDEAAKDIIETMGGLDPETGRQLPTFDTLEEAEAAAQARSRDDLGQYGAQPGEPAVDYSLPAETQSWLQPASEPPIDETLPADWNKPQPTTGESIVQATNSMLQGIVNIPAGFFKEVAILSKDVDDYVLQNADALKNDAAIQERFTYQLGQKIEAFGKQAFPTDPKMQEDFVRTVVPQAIGSMMGFLASGIAGAVAKAPGTVTAIAGAGLEAPEQYEDALRHGASEDTARTAAHWALPVGATEAIPVERLLSRFNQATGGRFLTIAKEAGVTAAQEFAQEFLQTVGGNAIAQQLYDEHRDLFKDSGESGAAGGIAGGLMGVLVGMLKGRRGGSTGAAARPEEMPGGPEPTAQVPQDATALAQPPPPMPGVPAVQTLSPIQQRPTAIKRKEPVELPKPVERPAATVLPPEIEQLVNDYETEYQVPEASDRPAPVETPPPVARPAVQETAPVETKGPVTETNPFVTETKGPINERKPPVKKPQAIEKPVEIKKPDPIDADMRETMEELGYSAPVEKPEVSEKPAPVNRGSGKKVTPPPQEVTPKVAPTEDPAPLPVPALSDQAPKPTETDNAPLPVPAEVYNKSEQVSNPLAESLQTAPIDTAAHDAATSPKNDLPQPTEGQKEAGNYKKGHVSIGGLPISIENPQGSVRSGTDKSGKPWSVEMKSHYGYILGTKGKDKEHLDVFVKPGTPEDFDGTVWVVDQVKPDIDSFDEHKVILGASSAEEAKQLYHENYAKGWKGYRAAMTFSMPEFKQWLAEGDTTRPVVSTTPENEAPSFLTPKKPVTPQIPNEEGTKYVLPSFVTGKTPPAAKLPVPASSDVKENPAKKKKAPPAPSPYDPNFKAPKGDLVSKPVFGGPESVIPAPLPVPEKADAPVYDKAGDAVANYVASRLADQKTAEGVLSLSSTDLFKRADYEFGGTQAQGTYTPKDAYDALELGINKYLISKSQGFSYVPNGTAGETKAAMLQIRKAILDKIPTQTRRTEEQIEFQQFSTPPDLAYAMAWAANLSSRDTVIEPSAGLGGLAVFAHNAGAKVVMNEFSDRRASLLKKLDIGTVYTENAEQLDNILPESVKPTVVLMNPPFSSTAGRIQGERKTTNGLKHLEQALKRLEPGGRLVALIGKGKVYKDPEVLERWLSNIAKQYAYRARIGLGGEGYKKYGTTYTNQIVVIDKMEPDGTAPVIADFADVLDAVPSLKEVRDGRHDRQAGTRPAEQPAPESARPDFLGASETDARPDNPLSPPAPALGPGQRKAAPGARPARPSGGRAGGTARPGAGRRPGVSDQTSRGPGESAPDQGAASAGDDPAGRGERSLDRAGSPPATEELELERPATTAKGQKADLTDAVYEDYSPPKFKVKGAKPHPGKLAESSALAAVEAPDVTYSPRIPQALIDRGELSLPQLEALAYTGQAHQATLPDGTRKGFFVGDGPGVGKGREIAGIIMDNWRQGRKKAIWISETQNLYNSAILDWTALGGKQTDLHVINKTKLGTDLGMKEGLLFSTYSTLASGLEVTKLGTIKAKAVKGGKPDQLGKTRLEQLAKWLGPDYDGVIIFDEAHNMANAQATEGEMGDTPPAARALAGIALQKQFPQARFVYSSATGATKVDALAYAERLGLWGEGTPFPSKNDFLGEISQAGLGAMEIVAQNLKAMGAYISRNLSYDGVTYDKIEHKLTPEQEQIYNEMATSWQLVLKNVNAAMEDTGITGISKTGATKTLNSMAKMRVMSKFWGVQLRFYNQILNSLQMPSVIADMKERRAKGEALVIQLTNTNEAATSREIEKMEAEGGDLASIDITPRQDLMNYVEKAFPVMQFEEYEDDDGNKRSRMVLDKEGKPVASKEAIKRRDDLLDKLGSLRVPEGPLELILNTFGPKNVAEVTGRKERILRYTDENGDVREEHEKGRSDVTTRAEVEDFLNDKRQILVFSEKGGTGESYHADLTKKNQRKRVHYLVQAGWRADKAVQGLGRTHRTNQKQPPHYILTMTNIKGHKRFLSTIARRLDQLGALTKGQRQAGSSGLIDAKDNLENRYATSAIKGLIRDVRAGIVPDITWQTVTDKLGLDNLIDKDGQLLESKIPDVPKFMNRVLALELQEQNLVFDAFRSRMDALVEIAQQQGTLDTGMETYTADGGVRELTNEVIYKDPTSGAPTNLVHLDATHKTQFVNSADAERSGLFARYVTNKRTGKVWGVTDLGNRTEEDGRIVHKFRLFGPVHGRYQYVDAAGLDENYDTTDKPAARKLWKAQTDAEPQTYSEKFYMVTGTMLNIWDKLPKEMNAKIRRVQTVEGQRHLGRIIAENHAQVLKENLGVAESGKPPALNPAQFFDQVYEKGATLQLANSWRIKRVKVANENRIEIIGDNLYPFKDELIGQGAFTERIQSASRYFIPAGTSGPGVLERILKYKPVVKLLSAAKQAMGNERGSIPLRQLVPGRTRVADEIQGAPNGLTFDNPDVEARFLAAKRGVTPDTVRSRLQSAIKAVMRLGREFGDLPDTAEYSPLRTSLLTLQKQKGVAADRVIRRLNRLTGQFGPQKMDLFTRKVLLDDLVREAELGREIPFGFTPETVQEAHDAINDLVTQNPDVADAVRERTRAWEELKGRYRKAMTAIGQERLADRLNKEHYFRHQVLEFAGARHRLPQGTGKELRSPTGRGFTKQRHGSTKDINANYLQADFEVMAQMEYDVEVAKTIKLVEGKHNIRPNLERQAKRANEQTLARLIQEERARLEVNITDLSPIETRLKDFSKMIGMGMSKVRREMNIPRTGVISFTQLHAWADDPESPAHSGALQAFKGISGRRQYVKELLGREFQTWEDLVPEGFQIWQPEQGNVFYMADSIPHQLARQLQEAMVDTLQISAEQLRKVLAQGGPKEQLVVDQNVYDTLRNMARPVPDVVKDTLRSAQGHMKQLFLLGPRRIIRYNLRNLTGDADAVFAGNPKAFRKVPEAIRDLWPVFFGKTTELTGTVKEWFDRGGFQSTLQVSEMGDLNELRIFRALLDKEARGGLTSLPVTVFNKYWQSARLATDYREGILRYANYVEYLEQMRAHPTGKPDNWGASIPENVLALESLENRAYKLSNELLGAYDRVSLAGQNLRNYWYPFFSWVEVNFRRYKQLVKNAFKDIGSAKLSRLGFTGAGKALKWMIRFTALWALLQAWNHLMFPDDEDELDALTKQRPHLLFGRDAKGNIRYLSGLGAMSDLLAWFGLDEAPALTGDVLHGRLTPGEAIQRMVKAPVNKFVQGITPFVKLPGELLARESLYPDVFRPRPINDRAEYTAQQFTVGDEYRALTGKPGKKYADTNAVAGLVVQRQNPGSAAYGDWQKIEDKWLDRFGKTKGIYFKSEKGKALQNIAAAIRAEDPEAEARWRAKYAELGGTTKSMAQSIRAMAPLSGMTIAERDQAVQGLDKEERKILKRAQDYYKEHMMQVLPEHQKMKLQKRLYRKGWLAPDEDSPAAAEFPLF